MTSRTQAILAKYEALHKRLREIHAEQMRLQDFTLARAESLELLRQLNELMPGALYEATAADAAAKTQGLRTGKAEQAADTESRVKGALERVLKRRRDLPPRNWATAVRAELKGEVSDRHIRTILKKIGSTF